ncbi:hypothetical protein AB0F71_19490 [Kitasatospora sp. NPDC028055]|uniref:hypothetical protein n=1 Tax=Kitasatospora sp. NPDC028055 TaxID=3155653 RepID=UPI00340600AD
MIFETQDEAELRAQLRPLREAGIDPSTIRIDMLCGRLVQPTTYRLSRFVTDPGCEAGHDSTGASGSWVVSQRGGTAARA